MPDGLDHVWRAAEILAGGDMPLRERLKEARGRLALSLTRGEGWPSESLHLARSIERIIRKNGESDPLDTMPADLARQVAEDLLSLAVDLLLGYRAESKNTVGVAKAAVPAAAACWQPVEMPRSS
jgi:hypothetical protein